MPLRLASPASLNRTLAVSLLLVVQLSSLGLSLTFGAALQDLWTKTMLEVHEHEDRCEANVMKMRDSCLASLDLLAEIIRV